MKIEEKIITDILNLTNYCQQEFKRVFDKEFFDVYPHCVLPDRRTTINRVVHSIIEAHVDYILTKVDDKFGEG